MPGEEWLPGNVAGVLKVGDTVHRSVGGWTPAVHALLEHLAPRLPHIPKVRGFDEAGREVLDFLPGKVIVAGEEVLSDAQIRSLVHWTKLFHAVVADFAHSGPWRYFPIPAPTLIGHNDIAPYNACFRGDDLTGVFDWDLAGPTTPLHELAFIAWNCVPLWSDIGADRAARRLSLIADTYGGIGARELLMAVPGRIQLMIDGIAASAAAGDPGMINLVAGGEQERDLVARAAMVARIPAILDRLP